MKILIVEDDENKRNQLLQFLASLGGSHEAHAERSLQSGLRRIRSEAFDVVLLDMTLPNFDTGPDEPGGKTHLLGGREFLRQMDRFGAIIPVIVVTQFEIFGNPPNAMRLTDLDAELRQGHPKIYNGIVYYHAAIHSWKEELQHRLSALRPHGE